MALFDMPRVPEPEVMDDSAEVEAYSSAAAQAYLNTIDDTLVEHALRLVKGRERERGRALDIGTGPGQIVIKIAKRLPEWKFTGVDRSLAMIAQAQANLASASGQLAGRVEFQVADGNRLPFPDGSFDLVMCNSVLHHLAEPEKLLSEMSRLVNSGGAILLRDLRRPARFAYPLHVRWHGRHYSGVMYRLYCDSVRSAYTVPELKRMLDSAALPRTHVFEHRSTHIGLERPIAS
jgi:ubiquinone/menaquinone biosynthesis C-methylase UbiE